MGVVLVWKVFVVVVVVLNYVVVLGCVCGVGFFVLFICLNSVCWVWCVLYWLLWLFVVNDCVLWLDFWFCLCVVGCRNVWFCSLVCCFWLVYWVWWCVCLCSGLLYVWGFIIFCELLCDCLLLWLVCCCVLLCWVCKRVVWFCCLYVCCLGLWIGWYWLCWCGWVFVCCVLCWVSWWLGMFCRCWYWVMCCLYDLGDRWNDFLVLMMMCSLFVWVGFCWLDCCVDVYVVDGIVGRMVVLLFLWRVVWYCVLCVVLCWVVWCLVLWVFCIVWFCWWLMWLVCIVCDCYGVLWCRWCWDCLWGVCWGLW